MTFGEAINAALRDLGLGETEISHDQYDRLFLQYANDAVLELSKDCRPVARDEQVSVTAGEFSLSALAHPVYNLLRVRAGDRIYHTRAEGDVIYLCADYTGQVLVTYEYYYEPAVLTTDTIPLPAPYLRLVPMYISSQFGLGGDRWQQQRGRTQLQMFQELRRDIKKNQYGATDSYRLKNRGW